MIIRLIKKKILFWKFQQGIKLLQNLDNYFKLAKYSRNQRRQFWRDVTKSKIRREELFKLFNEMNKEAKR